MPSERQPVEDQPDLRATIADAMNESARNNPEFVQHQGLTELLTPDQVTIPCQRTWPRVTTLDPKMNGADVSACFARFTQGENQHTHFFLTYRRLGEADWQPIMSQGGIGLTGEEPQFGGLLHARGHVCIGRINAVPDSGSIQIELADGSSYESKATDGCCIVFAPIATPPSPDDHFTVQYFNPDGSERDVQTQWIGDGRPPPGLRPAG